MSRTAHWLLSTLTGYDKSYEEYREACVTILVTCYHADAPDSMAEALFLRNLAENVSMLAFLGWLTILRALPMRPIHVC